VANENPIHKQHVKVNIQVQQTAKALDKRYGTSVRFTPCSPLYDSG
jgi:hypothetical protein